MDSILLVFRSLNQGNSGFPDPNPACSYEIISQLLSSANITILLVGTNGSQQYQDSLDRYFEPHIDVVSLSEIDITSNKPTETRLPDYRPFVDRSSRVYAYIRQFHYDVVIFDVFDAPGFIPIRAKRTGLGLEKTLLVSWLRNCHEFLDCQGGQIPANFDPYMTREQLEFAERYCCENSDLVLSHTEAMLKWVLGRDWKIDTKKVVCLKDMRAASVFSKRLIRVAVQDAVRDRELHKSKEIPLVSMCVAHYNDGRNLGHLMKSIKQNNYKKFEIIVVDDGSTDTESVEIFKSLMAEYSSDSWKFIMKEENEGPGPTRNLAVSHAKADLIIFMDSDNLATKTMISDFVNAMSTSGADCLTCSMLLFEGCSASPNPSDLIECWMPLGGCVTLGFYHNFFGDTNFCVKKSVFEYLGGFSDILGIPEDWDFLARLVLSGFEMDVVPKGIYFYRLRKGGRFRSTWSGNSIETLRRRLLLAAGPHHQKLIHNLLLGEISENERLRASVWKLDRKVVKIALKLSNVTSEKHRLIVEKITSDIFRKLKTGLSSYTTLLKYLRPATYKKATADNDQSFTIAREVRNSKLFIRLLSESEFQRRLNQFGLPLNRLMFGFVGELSEQSNPLGFLRLAYWMQMSSDESFFVMVGDGKLRQETQATATKYRLQNFKWIPLLEKPEEFYPILSGLIVTGSFDQCPREMLQALACGVPVFSIYFRQAASLFANYGNGLVVKHDPERKDFADCFKLWKDNLEVYKAAAMETAELVRRNFGV